MAIETRPYLVTMKDGSKRVVEAANPSQVTRHIAKTVIESMRPASARDIIEITNGGDNVTIEKA